MPNFTWPAWPPYAVNGWMVVPTFPSTWFHPVLGSRTVADANAFALLDRSWSPTAGLADMRRTESEAEVVIQHDIALVIATMTGATPSGTPAEVNRRSASWQRVIDEGYWLATPLMAPAQAPIGGPAPVSEGRSPGTTPPPGSPGGGVAAPRSEQVAPIATFQAQFVSAGVPGGPQGAAGVPQHTQSGASGQPPQPGQPGHPGQPGQPQPGQAPRPGQPGHPEQPGHPQQQPPQPGQPQHPEQPEHKPEQNKPADHKSDKHK